MLLLTSDGNYRGKPEIVVLSNRFSEMLIAPTATKESNVLEANDDVNFESWYNFQVQKGKSESMMGRRRGGDFLRFQVKLQAITLNFSGTTTARSSSTVLAALEFSKIILKIL